MLIPFNYLFTNLMCYSF